MQIGFDLKLLEHLPHTIRVAPIPQHSRNILIRLSDRDFRLESCEPREVELIRPEWATGKALRKKHVRSEIEESKGRRHYSDHLTRQRIYENRPSENVLIAAKTSLPVSMTEDHGLWSAWRVVFGREPSAEIWRHTQ